MTLDCYPYQDEAARVLASRTRFGLFDEMGIGKTATAIRALDYTQATRCLVVCPASVREVWVGEFRKFGRVARKVLRCQSMHDIVAWIKGRFDTLVISFEQAAKYKYMIDAQPCLIEALVVDEFHFCKNPEAKRTQALFGTDGTGKDGLAQWAARVFMLTGTPMANDPIDIYVFLRACGVMPVSQGVFRRLYLDSRPTTYGQRSTVKQGHKLTELRGLISNNSMRRTFDDVGQQLPALWLREATLDGDTAAVADMLRQHPGLEDAITAAIDQGGLSFLEAQHIMTLRRLIGEAKAVPYAAMLIDELKSLPPGSKRVVMACHSRALDIVREALSAAGFRSVLIDGRVNENDRSRAIAAFQGDPDVAVACCNIRAAGVGLTLTASAALDMLEWEWSPHYNAQAIKRVHRIGQTQTTHARFFALAGSLDEVVTRIVLEKTAAIASVSGDAMVAAPEKVAA